VQDRLQDAKANGKKAEDTATAGEDTAKETPKQNAKPTRTRSTAAKSTRQRSRRFERENGGEADEVSSRTLLRRLEQQSAQLGILRSKLDETRKALVREQEGAKAALAALEEERRARERVEANLKRERSARQQAEGSVEEARATSSALEAQHHLLRAQLKVQPKRRFTFRRGR